MTQRSRRREIRILIVVFVWCVGLALVTIGPVSAQNGQDAVHLVEIRGVINPPVANYLDRALADAAHQNARLVVIAIDTPGGLDSSMRTMTQAILASPVPVTLYVSPSGARAASAGLFVMMASHVAAMAPGTNTGAAHPVGLGGDADEVLAEKVVHDAAAMIRSLAEERNRNAAWAEQAVRESVSITEDEALERNVIDVVARDLDHLLEQIHGRMVETSAGEIRLDVIDAPRHEAPMTIAERLLHAISDPNIAFILLTVGSIGIIAELYNPGALVPGITGLFALVFAFFALGNLPTNWAGVAFIVMALILFLAELNTDATGVLGTAAVVGFLLGGLILFRPLRPGSPALPDIQVSPWLVGGATVVLAGFILLVLGQVRRSRDAPLRTGYEQFVGQHATVYQELAPEGRVRFESQLWFARVQPEQKVPAGEQVRIIDVDELMLIVEPIREVQLTDE